MIAPGLPVPVTVTTLGTGFSPAFTSDCSTAKREPAFVRFGTVTCFGSISSTTAAAIASSGATTASHAGNHGRWR